MPRDNQTIVSADPFWKVLVEMQNGGKIHGARRKVGDVFPAPRSAMETQALEGIVEETPDPNPPTAPSGGKSLKPSETAKT